MRPTEMAIRELNILAGINTAEARESANQVVADMLIALGYGEVVAVWRKMPTHHVRLTINSTGQVESVS